MELTTFNPNKKILVTHCHGNLTRRKEEMEWNQAMMSQWSYLFLQSLCSLLLKFSLRFPLFSPFLKMASDILVWYDLPFWKEQMGFYMACFVLTRLPSKFARHGELSFLPQWVSATSALRG